ncbi:hypothetical protein WL21_01335 [Burkholderia ubonensis]|uniref:hypothetical protein n=1 Tax=Burkholderia ubonensis TaxID=101571 RepID=UPI000758E4BB|nr:hypothetical protein [Burkholderia ubonensis]KVO99334.1 hypothetical protein WJ81_29815 [Burkholderia ubonensis]KVZ55647.1 hypothetical protein WL20_26420 [Burkholderia ubonensis]KVZ68668.1 hypothetical protein WL21_01335 [Burkholderia ubonensis]OJA63550.1 hypothetical protein BGV68_02850 [Burkholderia ubonensis]
MEFVGWCWIGIKAFMVIWLASHIIRLFLPSGVFEWLESVDDFVLGRIASIPIFLQNLWLVSAEILYFVGNFFALSLIIFGAFLVSYSVCLRWASLQFTSDGLYVLAQHLADDKVAWSGATMLIAATVAICNMWKLNLDRKQYFEKKEKEARERIESRRKLGNLDNPI